MQLVVTVQFDALVKSFVRVVIAVSADAVAEAVAVGCAAAAAVAAAAVAAAPAAAAVVPAPAVAVVAVVVVVAAASSEVTSESLPWIFHHFLQSTNKEKMDQIKFVEFYLWNKGVQGLKNCDSSSQNMDKRIG